MQQGTLIYSEQELDKAADIVIECMEYAPIITFTGSIGAGKTTLIRHVLHKLGYQGIVMSPTFTYVVSYNLPHDKQLYHFDLYRLNSVHEFVEAGFDEYLSQEHSWCFIEWPAVVSPLLRGAVCSISLDYDDDKRIMKWQCNESEHIHA